MLRVSVCATSANLCVGFDAVGIAFKKYNEFGFEEALCDKLVGFYSDDLESNLVLKTYRDFFLEFNLEYKPVCIYMLKQDVPLSRGLGSSATCIVAGAVAANYISGNKVSISSIKSFVTKCEGHPDNVIPALIGGFCASFKCGDLYESIKYKVSDKLRFYALIPSFELSTSKARGVLPNSYSRGDVVNNISRIVNLPYALENGDLDLIKKLFIDSVHEPYRIPIILNACKVIDYFNDRKEAICISGAGPTLLLISDDEVDINELYGFRVEKIDVCNEGVIIDEI